jgi:hypothetical protein
MNGRARREIQIRWARMTRMRFSLMVGGRSFETVRDFIRTSACPACPFDASDNRKAAMVCQVESLEPIADHDDNEPILGLPRIPPEWKRNENLHKGEWES